MLISKRCHTLITHLQIRMTTVAQVTPLWCFRAQDIEILLEVCAALCNLSVGDENKFEVAKSGAVPALITHMQNEDMAIGTQCAAC